MHVILSIMVKCNFIILINWRVVIKNYTKTSIYTEKLKYSNITEGFYRSKQKAEGEIIPKNIYFYIEAPRLKN